MGIQRDRQTQTELNHLALADAVTKLPDFSKRRQIPLMRNSQVLGRASTGPDWLRPILENTIYHTVLDFSSIYQTPVAHLLCARYGVRTIHADSLRPK